MCVPFHVALCMLNECIFVFWQTFINQPGWMIDLELSRSKDVTVAAREKSLPSAFSTLVEEDVVVVEDATIQAAQVDACLSVPHGRSI